MCVSTWNYLNDTFITHLIAHKDNNFFAATIKHSGCQCHSQSKNEPSGPEEFGLYYNELVLMKCVLVIHSNHLVFHHNHIIGIFSEIRNSQIV